MYLSLYANSEKNRQIKRLVNILSGKYVWSHLWLSTQCISLICTSGSSSLANEKFLRLPQFCCFIWSLYWIITNYLQLLRLRFYRSLFVNHFVYDWMVLLHYFCGLGKSPAYSTKFIIWFFKMIFTIIKLKTFRPEII